MLTPYRPMVTTSAQPPFAAHDDRVTREQVALRLADQLALQQSKSMRLLPQRRRFNHNPIALAGQKTGQSIFRVFIWLDQC